MYIDPLIILLIGMIVVLGSILFFKMHAFLALFLGALVVGLLTTEAHLQMYGPTARPAMSAAAIQTLAGQPVGERIARGLGNTFMGLGLLIAMASIIGKALLDSGAADRIVRSMVQALGEKRAPAAFLGSGYVLGIPVFFDTVFYLLIPLAKAMATRAPAKFSLYVMCICAGTTMTHSLVPPTPGPLYAAEQLHVPLGLMMGIGLLVGAFTSLAGFAYAYWSNRRWPIPLRETIDVSLAELNALAAKDARELPPFWLSILPILLPVVLIAGSSIIDGVRQAESLPAWFLELHAQYGDFTRTYVTGPLEFLGEKNIALTIAAAIALATLAWVKRTSAKDLAKAVDEALLSAGMIIMITCMGGAFGTMLTQAAVGPRLQQLAVGYHDFILPLAFVVTALIRSAQGSATVAMYTAVPILVGFASPEILGCHPVWLAMAIGCGSKPIPWMNDSGFWLISRMTGFSEAETIRTTSATIAVEGLVGLPVVMILAKLFPLI